MIYGENRPFPPDIRIEKELKVLGAQGHRLTVLTSLLPKDAPEEEILVPNIAKVKRVSITQLNLVERLRQAFFLQYSNWLQPLINFIKNCAPDILHVHDLNLLPTTLRASRPFDLPVIADLHENMPAARRAYRSNFKLFSKLLFGTVYNYQLWRWHESRALHQCDRVIIVVPEAAERLYNYGIAKSNIVIVSNTEDESTFNVQPEKADPKILERYQSLWTVIYIGGISPHRGLDTTIRSLPTARAQIPNLRLVIVGAKNHDRQQITKMARLYGVDDIVEIIDWQPFDKISSYIFSSRVCLVPHNNFEHTQTTVPHKLFQYMICSKPVLVSNCRPLARIVNETQSGLVFEANNSNDLAKKLIRLYREPEQATKMGENGSRAANGSYAWRHDAKRLVQMYEELEKSQIHR